MPTIAESPPKGQDLHSFASIALNDKPGAQKVARPQGRMLFAYARPNGVILLCFRVEGPSEYPDTFFVARETDQVPAAASHLGSFLHPDGTARHVFTTFELV